jgi:hypothetical protein
MKKCLYVLVACLIAYSFVGCGGDNASKEKSKFDVMAEVLNAMSNAGMDAGMDESGYGDDDRSVARVLNKSVDPESESNPGSFNESFEIAPGFNVTIDGSIEISDTQININFTANSTLKDYTSDGYTLNGNLNETVVATITLSEQGNTGMEQTLKIGGDVNFSGKATGSFAFKDLTINLDINPQTEAITLTYASGSVKFDGVDVTNEFIAAMKEV